MTLPAGIFQSTMPPLDEIVQEEEQGTPAVVSQDGKGKATRKNKVTSKATSGKVEGRKLYLSEDIHFRLRMFAYQNGQKLSEAAMEVLDKALPKWDVNRTG